MKRFILLTFGFLGLGFYELSGGDDFDPAEARELAMETRQQLEIARLDRPDAQMATLAPADEQPRPPISADRDVVARSSLNLVSLNALEQGTDTATEPAPAVVSEPTPTIAPETPQAAPAIIRVAGIAAIDDGYQGITFAGLSTGASSDNVAPARDIRRVAGSVVNMRSGPGTNFGVVDQLTENTRVEVLEDAGNGWVQLRAVDGGTTGWMADFLLADG